MDADTQLGCLLMSLSFLAGFITGVNVLAFCIIMLRIIFGG